MKNRLLCSLAFLGLVLAFSARPNVTLSALAQGGGQRATGSPPAQSPSPGANANLFDVNGKSSIRMISPGSGSGAAEIALLVRQIVGLRSRRRARM